MNKQIGAANSNSNGKNKLKQSAPEQIKLKKRTFEQYKNILKPRSIYTTMASMLYRALRKERYEDIEQYTKMTFSQEGINEFLIHEGMAIFAFAVGVIRISKPSHYHFSSI